MDMDRDMDMDMDMHMVKSRCFASSFKKVPTKNSICGSSSLWALSGLTNPRFLPTRGMCMYLSALSFGVRRPILVWINEACASRVVAEHPSGAARHGGNATFLPCTPHTCPPPRRRRDPEHTEGFGAEHLRWAAPESVALCLWGRLRACTDLVGRAASGLGA